MKKKSFIYLPVGRVLTGSKDTLENESTSGNHQLIKQFGFGEKRARTGSTEESLPKHLLPTDSFGNAVTESPNLARAKKAG